MKLLGVGVQGECFHLKSHFLQGYINARAGRVRHVAFPDDMRVFVKGRLCAAGAASTMGISEKQGSCSFSYAVGLGLGPML